LAKSGGTAEISSLVHVAPNQKLSVALIFTGPEADASGVASAVMQALLEGKGIVPHHSDVVQLPLPDAVIPEELLNYAGFYATTSQIFKIEFDQGSNSMKWYSFADGAFSLANTLPYKSDGFFYDSGSRTALERRNQTNYLLSIYGSGTVAQVRAESVSPSATGIDAAAFAGKKWLFRNGSEYDFNAAPVETGTISELPGYVYLRNGGGYMLSRLLSPDSTEMCLSYARDIHGLSVMTDQGKKWLKAANGLYSECQDIPVLTDGESVAIGAQGLNEWRKSESQAIFDCSIPTDGRVMIFTSDLQGAYDSLMAGVLPRIINPGDYVAFIGKTGDAFSVKLSGQ